MLASILAQSHASPRLGGGTVNLIIIALVVGAVALVFWASRPSVMARYQNPPATPGEAPSAPEETEPRG